MEDYRDYYVAPEHIEIAKKNGIPEHLLKRRVYIDHMPLKRAMTKPPQQNRDGGKFEELWQEYKPIAKKNGISRERFYQRVNPTKGNMDPLRAASEPLGLNRRSKTSTFTDEELKTMRANGIPYAYAYQRYKNQGMSKEDAITKPVRTRRKRGDT